MLQAPVEPPPPPTLPLPPPPPLLIATALQGEVQSVALVTGLNPNGAEDDADDFSVPKPKEAAADPPKGHGFGQRGLGMAVAQDHRVRGFLFCCTRSRPWKHAGRDRFLPPPQRHQLQAPSLASAMSGEGN